MLKICRPYYVKRGESRRGGTTPPRPPLPPFNPHQFYCTSFNSVQILFSGAVRFPFSFWFPYFSDGEPLFPVHVCHYTFFSCYFYFSCTPFGVTCLAYLSHFQ